MPTYYAVTRSLDPATGDIRFGGATWTRGQPMVETVVRILRTPKGSFLPNPALGVDYSVVQKVGPGTAAAWRATVIAALAGLTSRGLITELQVTVEQAGTRLTYEVAFRDPRDTTATQLTRLRLAV